MNNAKQDPMPLLRDIGAVYFLDEKERQTGAWCRLTSMRVSPSYINIGGKIDRSPEVMDILSQQLARKIKDSNIPCDLTVGAEKGSIRLSSHVAFRLGVDSIYLEKEKGGAKAEETDFALGRHFIKEEEKDLIIAEDLITRGTTIRKLLSALRSSNVNIRAIALVINRSGLKEIDGIPIISLVDLEPYDLSEKEFREQFPQARIEEKPKYHWDELMAYNNSY